MFQEEESSHGVHGPGPQSVGEAEPEAPSCDQEAECHWQAGHAVASDHQPEAEQFSVGDHEDANSDGPDHSGFEQEGCNNQPGNNGPEVPCGLK